MFRLSLVILSAVFLSSCASVHEGNYAKEVNEDGKLVKSEKTKNGIVISGSENDDLASEYFTSLNFTFENTTSDWKHIKITKVDFLNGRLNKLLKIPVGEKLLEWSIASQQRKQISDHNSQMIVGAITAAAVGVAGLSKSGNTRIAAVSVAGAGAATLSYQQISNKLSSLEKAKVVPDRHLLRGSFYIPPGLFSKRWMTVYLKRPFKSPYLQKVRIDYLVNKKRESVVITLRGKDTSSDFQNRYHSVRKRELEQERRNNMSRDRKKGKKVWTY